MELAQARGIPDDYEERFLTTLVPCSRGWMINLLDSDGTQRMSTLGEEGFPKLGGSS
jgi:hypothetical protein